MLAKYKLSKIKKILFILNSGGPPNYKLSKDYQSGPLSFEYFSENEKVITNCGYGRKISKKLD